MAVNEKRKPVVIFEEREGHAFFKSEDGSGYKRGTLLLGVDDEGNGQIARLNAVGETQVEISENVADTLCEMLVVLRKIELHMATITGEDIRDTDVDC